MGKSILLFADGTGNSAGKLFKTNVWRLYQAVDASVAPRTGPRQVAFYHDGVGTSAFKPLQLLGGVFGVGLKRNVLDMYCFVCRNYRPGDDIYLFGFSRGAFTVRVLSSLLLTQGVVDCETDELMMSHAADAYRAYRRRYKLPLGLSGKKGFEAGVPTAVKVDRRTTYYLDTKVGLVDRIRDARDWAIKVWRSWTWSADQRAPRTNVDVGAVRFLGVWDTVSAYGMPLEELTRGIDEWIWPLSMPNTELSPCVTTARHALALDEERDSFQPLLWDEAWERARLADGSIAEGRLQQVWFAGVHSNLGGGYADDALSHVPLKWMMDEAALAGVRFKDELGWGWALNPDPSGRLYDSRSGLSAYYRPQTRRIAARLPTPPRGTRSLSRPGERPKLLHPVLVHEGVLARITTGTDRYAPISLPPKFTVVGPGQASAGTPHAPSGLKGGREEWVFDDYWRRRIAYFAAVAASLGLAAVPAVQAYYPPSACVGPQCALSPLIVGVGGVLPSLLSPWIQAFARTPGTFVLLVLFIGLMRARGAVLKARMFDNMRQLWIESYALPVDPARPGPPVASEPARPRGWVHGLRSSVAYQRALQVLKWNVVPSGFGILAFIALYVVGLLGGGLFAAYRGQLAIREATAPWSFCPSASHPPTFATSDPCWPMDLRLRAGETYRVTIEPTSPWRDGSIPADPRGIMPGDPWTRIEIAMSVPARRVLAAGWFSPVLRTTTDGGLVHLLPLDFSVCQQPACSGGGTRFTAQFEAERSGEASLFVNDVPFVAAYRNNEGEANVSLDIWNAAADRFERVSPR